MVGRIVGELGVDSYSLPHEEVRALYFLMDFEQSVPADEDRELNWEDPARAASLMPFSGSRALVDEAARRLTGAG